LPINIRPEQLAELMRKVLNEPTAELASWEFHHISYINTETANLGLYRFQGLARVGTAAQPWSVILKAVQAPLNEENPHSWNYHRREILAYQQGLLADLPGSVRAPRCLAITEYSQSICWLWLEDISASTERMWSLEEYRLAAHHLGQFNGAYLTDRVLPEQTWLSRDWLRGWLEFYDKGCRETLELVRDSSFWEHPLLRSAFPRPIVNDVLRLWEHHERLLTALHQLPQTFCHMDAYRPNLFLRGSPQGDTELVAIDWVFAGTGAVGEEIANLFAASLIWFEFEADQAEALDHAIFSRYLTGLRAAGWQGDERLVRLGYCSACALRWGVVGLWWLHALKHPDEQAEFETHWKRPMEDLVHQWAKTAYHVLELAKEAYRLQHELF
jgi:hypothetical protein